MKNILFITLLFLSISCKKEDKIFILKTIQLNHYKMHADTSNQNLFFRVFDPRGSILLAETGSYPSAYTLPAQFGVHPHVSLPLYAQNYSVQLWSDRSGLLGECEVDMHAYKIIFPIEMEVEGENLEISIAGSWE
ncbi:hypothetical protein ACFX5U_20515 [Sphingobacterium sp. SG20118]|uniref:hypothetical protein n=1 Tax=Sphingobacterium sp. SG20118 TaxID=3367156 RepID=UPI0037DFC171